MIEAVLFTGKLTLLLTIGALLAVALRNRSAAARHFVWTMTLASTLALAIAAPLTPPIEMPIPLWNQAAEVTAEIPRPSLMITPPSASPVSAEPLPPEATSRAVPPPGFALPSTATLLFAGWAGGGIIVIAWFAIGHWLIAATARRAAPASPDWSPLIADAKAAIGISRDVSIRLSSEVGAPMTLGAARPVILLPAEAAVWPEGRLRAALLHELSHVGRNDWLIHLLAGVACALYWFHPMVWLGRRRIRTESEHATDDRVIERGMIAPDYATHLFDVANAAWNRSLPRLASVGMANRSNLERRLQSLLDPSRPHGGVSRRIVALSVVAAVLLLVPLAAAVPGDHNASSVDRSDASVDEIDTPTPTPTSTPTVTTSEVSRRNTHAFERTFDVGAGGSLELDLDTGATLNIEGHDLARVIIEGTLDGKDAANTEVDATRDGRHVRLTAHPSRSGGRFSTSHLFNIRVPRRFDIHIDSAGGGIAIADVEGRFTGETGGGDIVLRRLKGEIRMQTGGGELKVDDCDLDGRVITAGGRVNLTRIRGDLEGLSYGDVHDELPVPPTPPVPAVLSIPPVPGVPGVPPAAAAPPVPGAPDPITPAPRRAPHPPAPGVTPIPPVRPGVTPPPSVPPAPPAPRLGGYGADMNRLLAETPHLNLRALRESMPGLIEISKSGGQVVIDRAPDGAIISTGGGRIVVGPSSGLVVASTGGGQIEVGPTAGSVRASTGNGSVSVAITETGGEQTVDVISGKGNVVVELPAGFDGRFDIETAYIDADDPKTIVSDFPLKHDPVTGWDSSQGTPRRYVRASGVAGSGRGLVRITTGNGDVRIKRR